MCEARSANRELCHGCHGPLGPRWGTLPQGAFSQRSVFFTDLKKITISCISSFFYFVLLLATRQLPARHFGIVENIYLCLFICWCKHLKKHRPFQGHLDKNINKSNHHQTGRKHQYGRFSFVPVPEK